MKGKLTLSVEREEACEKEGLGVIRAFPPLSVSAPFCRTSNSTMLGQSIWRYTTSMVCRSLYEEDHGRTCHFHWETRGGY